MPSSEAICSSKFVQLRSRPTSSITMGLFLFSLLSSFSFLLVFPTGSATTSALQPNQDNITATSFKKLQLPPGVYSPESLAFNILGEGPYTGVSDGRILKYVKLTRSFVEFAHTSPNRNRSFCDGTNSVDKHPTCGQPLGLSFDLLSARLYACDQFTGLTVVSLLGGLATTLVPTVNGVPYRFLVAVDVAIDGAVYFTDASLIYGPKDSSKSIETGDSTARVLKYDPLTETVTVLITQLSGAVGVATNNDASVLLISEFIAKRIRRYWLKGQKAGTSDILLTLSGNPNKIKRNQDGDFWVAVNNKKNDSTVAPQALKISASGKILATIDLSNEYNRRISVVQQSGEKLYVGGINYTFVGQYDLTYA